MASIPSRGRTSSTHLNPKNPRPARGDLDSGFTKIFRLRYIHGIDCPGSGMPTYSSLRIAASLTSRRRAAAIPKTPRYNPCRIRGTVYRLLYSTRPRQTHSPAAYQTLFCTFRSQWHLARMMHSHAARRHPDPRATQTAKKCIAENREVR